MNLQKLFEAQAELDKHIYEQHPVEDGEDRLAKKILALQVELAECANESRCFKYWSNDQEPRYSRKEWKIVDDAKVISKFNPSLGTDINYAAVEIVESKPLLEEYVDCLHFILSIGLEFEKKYKEKIVPSIKLNENKKSDITNQFNELFLNTTSLFISTNDEYYDFEDTIGIFSELLESFVGLGEMLGFTWEQIEQAYFEKNAVNHQRQESGY